MAYEIYSKKNVRRTGGPQLAFLRTGRIAFNKAATAILTEQVVELVLLLWDSSARKVAIKPITKKDPRAYKVNVAKRDNTAGFSAKTFLEDIGIDYEKGSLVMPVVWLPEQGIFEVSLADAVVAPQRKSPAKPEKPLLSVAKG